MADIDRDLLEALQIADENSTDDHQGNETPRDEGLGEDGRGQPSPDTEQEDGVGKEGLGSAPDPRASP